MIDEDNLRWKTTFDRATLYYLNKKHLRLLILTVKAQLTANRKSYQLSKPEIEFHVMEEIYAVLTITHVHMCRKDDIFRQRRLNHSGMWECDYGTQSHAAKPYS